MMILHRIQGTELYIFVEGWEMHMYHMHAWPICAHCYRPVLRQNAVRHSNTDEYFHRDCYYGKRVLMALS